MFDISSIINTFFSVSIWFFIIPVLYLLLFLFSIMGINYKLGDIRDLLKEKSKNSGN